MGDDGIGGRGGGQEASRASWAGGERGMKDARSWLVDLHAHPLAVGIVRYAGECSADRRQEQCLVPTYCVYAWSLQVQPEVQVQVRRCGAELSQGQERALACPHPLLLLDSTTVRAHREFRPGGQRPPLFSSARAVPPGGMAPLQSSSASPESAFRGCRLMASTLTAPDLRGS